MHTTKRARTNQGASGTYSGSEDAATPISQPFCWFPRANQGDIINRECAPFRMPSHKMQSGLLRNLRAHIVDGPRRTTTDQDRAGWELGEQESIIQSTCQTAK
ncbi:hypothetical protein E4U33_003711 [Claviceps sp. LM78 group G4]|nr:hypothetical protein E4U33_003711 [Claviceps sp. LM78 group G4]